MALIYCTKCGKKISDKAYECVHCGYSAQREEEERQREQQAREEQERREQQAKEEQERLKILSEQKKTQNKVRLKKIKKIAIGFCIGVVVLCLLLAAGNVIYSKVCFNKAVEYYANVDKRNGKKYLEKSKKTWLNLNDYKQIDQAYLESAKKCIGKGDYEKAYQYFKMIQDNSVYISEIKDIYVNEILNLQDWDEEAEGLLDDMEAILNRKDPSVFGREDKKKELSSIRKQEIEKGNFNKAGNILSYEMENGVDRDSEEINSAIYQVAVGLYENKDYSTALEFFNYITRYENSSEYIDNILMYEELCYGEISIKYIERANSTEEFEWDEKQQRVITEAVDYMNRLQGCYEHERQYGKPFYIYVTGYDIYHGDETAVIKESDAKSCKFVLSNHCIKIEGGLMLSRIVIESENQIEANGIYQRVEMDKLPAKFDSVISNTGSNNG